jgi:ribonuclease BN (tRNA processing enzyme)
MMRGCSMLILGICTLAATTAAAQNDAPAQCGSNGVWIQVLGSGASELTDDRAGPSYLLWIDGRARVMINSGPGSALRFHEAGARFEDLDAIAYTQLQADHVSDLPAFLRGGLTSPRSRPLTLLGPEGSARWPALTSVVERLVGEGGAFPQFSEYLDLDGATNYRLRLRDVPATGARRWAQFGTEHFTLSAVPVNHGDIPALAWRIEAGGRSVSVAGSFNNQRNAVPAFAAGTDALIVHHAIPENARGPVRDFHVRPTQIGRIAAQAQPRVLILAYRTLRTRGYQTQSLDLIAEHYGGRTVLASDTQCLGLG